VYMHVLEIKFFHPYAIRIFHAKLGVDEAHNFVGGLQSSSNLHEIVYNY
jgi:hypothetical protein